MIETCGLSHSVLLSTQNAIWCQREAKEFRRCEIVRKGKEMEDKHFRVERQKESKDRKYFKSSMPQGTGYESNMMWYVLRYACLFPQTRPNKH